MKKLTKTQFYIDCLDTVEPECIMKIHYEAFNGLCDDLNKIIKEENGKEKII